MEQYCGPKPFWMPRTKLNFNNEPFWCEPWAQYDMTNLTPVEPKQSLEETLDQLAGLVKPAVEHNKFPASAIQHHPITRLTRAQMLERVID